ncbi:sugar-binding protein [Mobilicoccus massiliensis]|uniref:sugar-binding protein n=1 Tax=Mobilicoccus massiliensis TaxID=1522310 RepID=UPI00058D5258|nr:sugar-binding protein [Mobilicoccus massiliensis]
MPRRTLLRAGTTLAAAAALGLAPALAHTTGAASADGAAGRRPTAAPPDATTSSGRPVDLGALYIGAHPDDEAWTLSTIGQWGQRNGLETGVVTVTRGEGGGNAVGPEEGPALGLLREREERAAVGRAGITNIYNLDEVDFFYTVSEPLTRQTWGHDRTLAKIVRVIRETRPEILVTMNPAPSPGNHGNHQEAARLAIEAYEAAGDPKRFPEQITKEGLRPWAPAKVFRSGYDGTSVNGPECAAKITPKDPSSTVYGVWSGAKAPDGKTWAEIERAAQRQYASQGWAGFPDVPADPNQLGCDFFTQVASRVPFAAMGTKEAADPAAALQGATVRASGGLPLGTRLEASTASIDVLPGKAFTTTVRLTAPPRATLRRARASLTVPSGWKAGRIDFGTVRPGRTVTRTVTVTPDVSAKAGTRVKVGVDVAAAEGRGHTETVVAVTAPVTAHQQFLPQVAQFENWVREAGLPELSGIVTPVTVVPSGRSASVPVVVTNHSASTQSGTVTPAAPAGFTVEPASRSYTALAPGASTTLQFTVENTDTSLKTSNQGGTPGGAPGDYRWTIATTSGGATSQDTGALELVPSTTIPRAATAPAVDGKVSNGEYPAATLDLSRVWEGEPCTSAADCSATANVTWRDDTLYVAVTVKDDVLGTKLDSNDCKRHWRTDAVELAFDPRGTSENTSTTFKAFILPVTAQGGACFGRDADNRQGGAETAPGMKVASTVTNGGYTVETSIPMADLPGAIDPAHLGMNLFVYDSDTQDKTGQTRIGWSTWGGVQGDPYRWGVATVQGYTPPAGRPTTPPKPVMPLTALKSVDSPPSIEQSVRDNVPLAGGPASDRRSSGWLTRAQVARGSGQGVVRVTGTTTGRARTGAAHVFVVDASGIAGRAVVPAPRLRGSVNIPLTRALEGEARAVAAWDDGRGTLSSAVPIRR